MRRLSQKQINKRLSGVDAPIFLIRDSDESFGKKYYLCPIGWDRERAMKVNQLHQNLPEPSIIGVEQYDPDCFGVFEETEKKIYDFAYLPIYPQLVDFHPGLLDGTGWNR